MQNRIQHLADSLVGTSLDAPRPIADLEIPEPARTALLDELGRLSLKPAAVLVGILPGKDAASIVLTERSENLKNHPGQISFPGGSREEDDTSLTTTALRESHEEIALPVDMVEVMGYLPDYPTITGYRVTPVVGMLDPAAESVMQPDGVEATRLIHLPLERALDITAYEKKIMQRNGFDVPVFHLAHENDHIWGATAGMLYQLSLHFRRFG